MSSPTTDRIYWLGATVALTACQVYSEDLLSAGSNGTPPDAASAGSVASSKAGGGAQASGGNSSGGSGGLLTPDLPTRQCQRSAWIASAFPAHPSGRASNLVANNAIDESELTRWASGKVQTGDEWYVVNFPHLTLFSAVTLDTAATPSNYPRGYTVEASPDGINFAQIERDGVPIEGVGAPVTRIEFELPILVRALRISQTGRADAPAVQLPATDASLAEDIADGGLLEDSAAPADAGAKSEGGDWWSIHDIELADCVEYVSAE